MNMKKKITAILAALSVGIIPTFAEINYDIRFGINAGATSPMPFPVEVRSINSYTLTFQPAVEAGARYNFTDKTGIRSALIFEIKDMLASADVKNYKMAITGDDGSRMSGYWTGSDETNIRNVMLSIPLEFAYTPSAKFMIHAGPYVSFLITRRFSGKVYDGYLRKGEPTGDRISYYDGAYSDYDFSDNVRNCQFGISAAADYNIGNWLLVSLGLKWGLTNIFESSFETISFKMYPIYANLSLGYRF